MREHLKQLRAPEVETGMNEGLDVTRQGRGIARYVNDAANFGRGNATDCCGGTRTRRVEHNCSRRGRQFEDIGVGLDDPRAKPSRSEVRAGEAGRTRVRFDCDQCFRVAREEHSKIAGSGEELHERTAHLGCVARVDFRRREHGAAERAVHRGVRLRETAGRDEERFAVGTDSHGARFSHASRLARAREPHLAPGELARLDMMRERRIESAAELTTPTHVEHRFSRFAQRDRDFPLPALVREHRL
jgi:hypothetical protein